jgi:hypothetical protein
MSPSSGSTTIQLASTAPSCAQRTDGIHLVPPSGSATSAIASAYAKLGAEGGGTLYLDAGTFVLQSTLNFQGYGNVSIQGAGEASTVIEMMPDPVGHFTGTNGDKLGHVPGGTSLNMIEVSGTQGPIWNFEMCDLTVNAEANTASEAWQGSLIYDYSGGHHHVYSNIALTGFWGPGTTPNGLHLIPAPMGYAATGYVVNHLVADDNSKAFVAYKGYKGGPNFLNIDGISNCHITNVTGIGLLALEYAPSTDCFFGYWKITGHMLIDPATGGSWEGSRFAHIIVTENGTAAPNALQVDVSTDRSEFTSMSWTDDAFYGPVLDAVNMLSVSHSTFDGGLDVLPPTFVNNTIDFTNPGPDSMGMPIHVDGSPGGGTSADVSGNAFSFPSGTMERDPLLLTVPNVILLHDTFSVSETRATSVAESNKLDLSTKSCFGALDYLPTSTAPSHWSLIDLANSPGFLDLGAWVGKMTHISNDLPLDGVLPSTCRSILNELSPVVASPVGTGGAVQFLSSTVQGSVVPPSSAVAVGERLVATWVSRPIPSLR